MLVNAREGDFIEVTSKDNQYYGMIGCIQELKLETATVDIYGKNVVFFKTEMNLRARAGTATHDVIKEQLSSNECMHLDEVGYDGLINFAIDTKDFQWATELVHRKNEYIAQKKVKK